MGVRGQFAGGLRSDALLRRIQIDRVLPPGERRPGADRGLVDVERFQVIPLVDQPETGERL